MSESIVIAVLTEAGMQTARRIQSAIPGSTTHGFAGRVSGADYSFTDVAELLRSSFLDDRGIVAVCATGIVVRALAPLLRDKRVEPPVVVVAENGSSVIPLLGGHQGGNALARAIAACLEVEASITTASETRFGVALDDPPAGWMLANPSNHKAFVAQLLTDGACAIDGDAPWLAGGALPVDDGAELRIHITDAPLTGSERVLVYHPVRLAIGVGCERGIDPAELKNLVSGVLESHGLAPQSVAGVFSLDLKADEVAIHTLAEELRVPARFFDAQTLEAQTPRLPNPSELVFQETGCHGVSEAAALAAAGDDARLVVQKCKSRRATCAVARAAKPFDGGNTGRPRGRLSVVGLGPGTPAWCTPEARLAVDTADHVVGYRGYLDLAGPLSRWQKAHAFPLGQEQARVSRAFELASAGSAVALVCSGDPGIYAMASLVYELLEHAEQPAWRRVAVEVIPGVSAVQGAAARIGAPLGHDFCVISLSDLLTPWSVIENRLEAAAKGDFVLALYNPSSAQRTSQLPRAATILAHHRPADTPVVVARNVGRPDESLRVLPLSDLDKTSADMLSLVIIGSSTSRRITVGGVDRVYTPRGYARKRSPEAAA